MTGDPDRGQKLERLGGMFDRVSEGLRKVDDVIQQHGGPAELRDKLASKAEELVQQVEEVAARVGAIEGEVVESEVAPVAGEAAATEPLGTHRRRAPSRTDDAITWRSVLVALAAAVATVWVLRRFLRR